MPLATLATWATTNGDDLNKNYNNNIIDINININNGGDDLSKLRQIHHTAGLGFNNAFFDDDLQGSCLNFKASSSVPSFTDS